MRSLLVNIDSSLKIVDVYKRQLCKDAWSNSRNDRLVVYMAFYCAAECTKGEWRCV